MQKGKRRISVVVFFAVVVMGGSLFALALAGRAGSLEGGLPARVPNASNDYVFGSIGRNFTGWLIPANTLISTSYVTNQSSNGFVSANLNVFPYRLPQNGVLYLGLYLNGELAANDSYNLGQSVAHPATFIRSTTSQSGTALASFSPSLEGYSVSLFLHHPLPSGTTITVTTYVSQPIWVQIDQGATSPSYIVSTSTPVPSTLGLGQVLAPYTLSIQAQSNAA